MNHTFGGASCPTAVHDEEGVREGHLGCDDDDGDDDADDHDADDDDGDGDEGKRWGCEGHFVSNVILFD